MARSGKSFFVRAPRRERLVVLRALGLGDLLMAVPALRALAREFPRHQKILAAPRELAPLAIMTGAVDEVVDCRTLAPLPRRLRHPAVAVNMHDKGPESHQVLLDLRPRRLIAFANEKAPRTSGSPSWRPGEHIVQRWCRLMSESGISANPAELDLPRPLAIPLPGSRDATVIHPGTAEIARRWPAERWVEVARHEKAAGRRVLLTGLSEEIDLCFTIALRARLPEESVIAGCTSLIELAAVISNASRLLSADTGPAHLATAMRTPSVTIFGPTSPHVSGPPTERDWHRVLWAGKAGDTGRRVIGHDPTPGEIGVEQVIDAVESLPKRQREDSGWQAPSSDGDSQHVRMKQGAARSSRSESSELPGSAGLMPRLHAPIHRQDQALRRSHRQ